MATTLLDRRGGYVSTQAGVGRGEAVKPAAGRKLALVALHGALPPPRDKADVPASHALWRLYAAVTVAPIADLTCSLMELAGHDADAIADAVLATDPDVIGFSVYVWSFALTCAVTRVLHARRPGIPIILGGPCARPAMFALAPYHDVKPMVAALCLGEGENVLREVMLRGDRSPAGLMAVSGLALPTPAGWHYTPAPRPPALDLLPSPYQHGLVPGDRAGVLEVSRGCAMSCAFCQWGAPNLPDRCWSAAHLARELEAMRAARVRSVTLADASLNLNPNAFERLVHAQAQSGFLQDVGVSLHVFGAALRDEHIAFLRDIRVAQLAVGVHTFDTALSQKLQRAQETPQVLRSIALLGDLPQTSVELTLGLPHDTPDAFKAGVRKAMDLNVGVIDVFHSLVLPDGLMTRAPADSALVFDPVTLKTISATGWSEQALKTTMRWLTDTAEDAGGEWDGTRWRIPTRGGPRRHKSDSLTPNTHLRAPGMTTAETSVQELDALLRTIPLDQQFALGEAILRASDHTWKLAHARWVSASRVGVTCQTPQGPFEWRLQEAAVGTRSFVPVRRFAVSHLTPIDPAVHQVQQLRKIAGAILGHFADVTSPSVSG